MGTQREPSAYFNRKKDPSEMIDLSTIRHGTIIWEEIPGEIGRRERILMRTNSVLGVSLTVCLVVSLCEYREMKRRSSEERALTHRLRSKRSRESRGQVWELGSEGGS
jgi:hypothetical protein